MDDTKQEQEQPVINWRINEWFPDLSPNIKSGLKAYFDELLKINKTQSLVSAKTIFVADALHFADSINASRIIASSFPGMDTIYDLGSGAGFPGVVFALLNPNVKVVLIEADSRKCEFLNNVVKLLNLKNVVVEGKTVEALPEASVRYAMARGLSSISKTIMSARKCVAKGGMLFHLKGEEWGIELSEIPTQLCSIWSPSLLGEYKLPVGAMKFSVIKTDKIA